MLVKCISPRLRHIHFGTDGNGKRSPKRIRVGDTFPVKSIPPEWQGLVIPVEGGDVEKTPVTNPQEPDELAELKAEYKERTGVPPHYSWDAERIKEKLAELDEEDEDDE